MAIDRDKIEEVMRLCKMSDADLRLHMGEMTRDELRTVRAMLKWILAILER